MRVCVYTALCWNGVASRVYSCLTPSAPRIVSVSAATLTRLKYLLKVSNHFKYPVFPGMICIRRIYQQIINIDCGVLLTNMDF